MDNNTEQMFTFARSFSIMFLRKEDYYMATSSISESVRIKDKKTAKAFINAIDSSSNARDKSVAGSSFRDSKLATKADSKRLHKLRLQGRKTKG